MSTLSFGNKSLPDHLDARVRSILGAGEKLQWVGQPRPGLYTGQAMGHVLFGMIFISFGLHGMRSSSFAWFDDIGKGWLWVFEIPFSLMGGLPVLAGVGMLSSPYWLRRKAKRTCYVLTDRRAILWEPNGLRNFEVRAYEPGDLTKIRCVEHSNRSGDLVFEEITTIGENSDGFEGTTIERHGFMGVDGVREIEALLRKTLSLGDREVADPAVRVVVLKPERSIPDPPSDSTIRLNVGRDGTEFVRRSAISPTALRNCIVANLFWNGILGVALVVIPKQEDWSLYLFLIPFELIGLLFLIALPLNLLAPFWVEGWVMGSGEVVARSSFLGLGRTRRFEARELGRVERRKCAPDQGAESDSPYSLGFVSREGRDLFVVNSLSEGEARWVGGVACNALQGWLPRDSGQW